MNSINRQVAIIKPKKPYADWISSLPGIDEEYSIESLSDDCTAILLPQFDNEEQSLNFIKKIYKKLFEIELASWNTDLKTWPKNRTYKIFCEWFKIEMHTEILDFGKDEILIEEY
jgi:hypothetical protein